jgi:hypothetical protein
MARTSSHVAIVFAGLVVASACFDPTRSREEEELGPETEGLEAGPLHRPGQPCRACHRKNGTSPELSVAGTVYARRPTGTDFATGAGMMDVDVLLKDANGAEWFTKTNATGNFLVRADDWTPAFPLRVAIRYEGTLKRMETRIGRDGGCGSCHRAQGDASHVAAVYVKDVDEP